MAETNRITLRAAVDEDESLLYQLYASTRQAELALWPGPPESKRGFLRMQFQAQRKHYRSLYPGADHSIVVTEAALAGRLCVDRQASQILIVDLTLSPEFHQRGIGRGLVSQLRWEAARLGKVLTGHVERRNPAVGFWRRIGFDVADEDEMYYRISWLQSPRSASRGSTLVALRAGK